MPREAKALQLRDKDFKSTILSTFKELKETMYKELKRKYDNISPKRKL